MPSSPGGIFPSDESLLTDSSLLKYNLTDPGLKPNERPPRARLNSPRGHRPPPVQTASSPREARQKSPSGRTPVRLPPWNTNESELHEPSTAQADYTDPATRARRRGELGMEKPTDTGWIKPELARGGAVAEVISHEASSPLVPRQDCRPPSQLKFAVITEDAAGLKSTEVRRNTGLSRGSLVHSHAQQRHKQEDVDCPPYYGRSDGLQAGSSPVVKSHSPQWRVGELELVAGYRGDTSPHKHGKARAPDGQSVSDDNFVGASMVIDQEAEEIATTRETEARGGWRGGARLNRKSEDHFDGATVVVEAGAEEEERPAAGASPPAGARVCRETLTTGDRGWYKANLWRHGSNRDQQNRTAESSHFEGTSLNVRGDMGGEVERDMPGSLIKSSSAARLDGLDLHRSHMVRGPYDSTLRPHSSERTHLNTLISTAFSTAFSTLKHQHLVTHSSPRNALRAGALQAGGAVSFPVASPRRHMRRYRGMGDRMFAGGLWYAFHSASHRIAFRSA